MTRLTENFRAEEFSCKCGECDGGKMNYSFMQSLQKLRETLGRPITINDNGGFRCKKQNEKSGGAEKSMHMLGRAADISAISGGEKYSLIVAAIACGFKGIGIGKTFIHVDNRGEGPVMWTY